LQLTAAALFFNHTPQNHLKFSKKSIIRAVFAASRLIGPAQNPWLRIFNSAYLDQLFSNLAPLLLLPQ